MPGAENGMSRDGKCRNCDEPCDGSHSLPVNNNAEFISCVDEPTEWGAVPCCKACHDLHAAAGVNGPAVLAVYNEALSALQQKLDKFRRCRRELAEIVDDMEAE